MELICIGSSSAGNCYVLKSSTGQMLLLEAGIHIDKVKKAVNYNISRIAGTILSHSHQDHSKSVWNLMNSGVRLYSSAGTISEIGAAGCPMATAIKAGEYTVIGEFQVKAFDIHHDSEEPFGFLIWHKEMGLTLFMTDTYYCDFRFHGLNHILIEANYSQERLDKGKRFLRDRVMESHMSIDACISTLKTTDMTNVRNIVLIHLSDSNSDEADFVKRVENITGKEVFAADAGLVIDFNKTPF